MLPERRVSAAELVAELAQGAAAGAALRLDTPPSWAELKPQAVPHLRRLAAGGMRIALAGYPLCALSSQDRGLFARPPETQRRDFDACWRCGLRLDCSPPAAWSDELEPFGPRDPMLLWLRFHRHACARLGLRQDPLLDELVDLAVGACVGGLTTAALTLEPSVVVEAGAVAPAIRLAMFHGEPAPDVSAALRRNVLNVLYGMQQRAGYPVAQWLGDALSRLDAVDVFLGFDARPDQPLLIKNYLTTRHLTPDARRSLAEDLVRAAAATPPAWWPEVDWAATDMIGLGWRAEGLVNVKLYVARNPADGWAAAGLDALPPVHPGLRLSAGIAYAVVDAAPADARVNKWDCRVRDQLLTGKRLSSAFGDVLGETGRQAIADFMRDCPVRTDTANVGFRGSQVVFYAWLG